MLNSRSWPMCNGDTNFPDQHTRTTPCLTAYEKDAVRKAMLEHDAVFKNQVYELHRLYKVQQELMEDLRRNRVHRNSVTVEPCLTPTGDSWKWRFCNIPSPSSVPGPLGSSYSEKVLDLHLCADEYIEDNHWDPPEKGCGARPVGSLGLLLGRGVGIYALKTETSSRGGEVPISSALGNSLLSPVSFSGRLTPQNGQPKVALSPENNCLWLSYMFEQERKRVGLSIAGPLLEKPDLISMSCSTKEHDLFPVPEGISVISNNSRENNTGSGTGRHWPNGVDLNVVLPGLCGSHLNNGWETADENPVPKESEMTSLPSSSPSTSSCPPVEERPTESTESRVLRRHIDLNLCAAEEDDEEDTVTRTESTSEDPVTRMESTSEDPVTVLSGVEAAAEAILMISSSRIKHGRDSPSLAAFHMFVDAVFSARDDDVDTDANRDGDGVDHFEAMTLKLKEERLVGGGEAAAGGPPEGIVGGRGRQRQRRDFRRDILPGIVTLSRQEVSEDLQRFGGMLRAAGHIWRSGPHRRGVGRRFEMCAGGGKGESGLEEARVGGWGKTTRRRRRPRSHLGTNLVLNMS